MSDMLEHRLHVKTTASQPSGRGTWVYLDGEEFYCNALKIEFETNDLNTVTLTFNAHVTIEEVD
jgi:hypothetical protein